MNELIRLFKAVPINAHGLAKKETPKTLFQRTIQEGFIFSDEVISNYSDKELEDLFLKVKEIIGINGLQLNSSFHKSWQKVRDASEELLILEQIIHYFTTYGFEALGIYNKESVYIPDEELDIPDLNLKLTIINGLTKEEIKEKLLVLLNSGIALSGNTIKDVVEVVLFVKLETWEIDNIKNKEVKSILYDYLGLVPQNAVEFLRYVVYKATDNSLLIKNAKTIETIKAKKNLDILGLFEKYQSKYGLEKLAEIFYRFKPLFLAFRTNVGLRRITNKIRKLAIKNHKPMPEDYLNTITALLRQNETINYENLRSELERVNIFRKIRLAYALNYRTKDNNSILYKIRNGKGFATPFQSSHQDRVQEVLDIVLNSIIKNLKEKVKGKKIFIPENITYALPATEKQFTGNFPSGTCVEIPNDMVFGVHWENVKDNRIDLDLSLIDVDSKYGWDSDYRNESRTILFSGDVTDAPKPNGASELFYIKRNVNKAVLMVVNYYNHDEDSPEVPIKIFVAKEEITRIRQNYMVNPDNIVALANSTINNKQKILGLVISDQDKSKFYFSETYLGRSITSSNNEFVDNARKYLASYYSNTISLNDMLEKAGAILVKEKENADIDLSIEVLTKDSIINLLK
jgi:hypothetical protein